MGRILFCVAIAALAGGCRWKTPPHAPETPQSEASVKLPEAVSGKPTENVAENDVLLNVSSIGDVVPPADGPGESRALSSIPELEEYLRRRADTDKMQTSKEKPEGVPILRIDRDTPFEKAYPVLRACRLAGYEKYLLQVQQPAQRAVQRIPLPLEPPEFPTENPRKFVVRFETANNGQMTAITWREEGSPDDGESLGAELSAYEAKLRTIGAAEKKRIANEATNGITVPPPQLTLELSDKLLHGTVVKLLDTALHAGFGDVILLPIDPAKR